MRGLGCPFDRSIGFPQAGVRYPWPASSRRGWPARIGGAPGPSGRPRYPCPSGLPRGAGINVEDPACVADRGCSRVPELPRRPDLPRSVGLLEGAGSMLLVGSWPGGGAGPHPERPPAPPAGHDGRLGSPDAAGCPYVWSGSGPNWSSLPLLPSGKVEPGLIVRVLSVGELQARGAFTSNGTGGNHHGGAQPVVGSMRS